MGIYKGNGQEIVLDVKASPLKDHTGEILGIVGVSKDITEKRRQFREIQQSEKLLSSLVNSHTNFLIRIATNQLYSFVNAAYAKKLGYKREEIIGKNYHQFIHPDDFLPCDETAAQCFQNPGKVFPVILRKHDRQGQYYLTKWEFVGFVGDSGIVEEIQAVGYDITEQKKAEEKLIQTRAFLSNALHVSKLGVAGWNLKGESSYWSDELYDILGIEKGNGKDPSPKDWDAFVIPEDHHIMKALIPEILQGKGPVDFEVRIVRKNDDEIRFVRVSIEIINNGKDSPFHIVGVFKDITDQRNNEVALRKYSDRLKMATESAGVGVWEIDLGTNTLFLNDQMFDLYEVDGQQENMENVDFAKWFGIWNQRLHPEDMKALIDSFEQVLSIKTSFDNEFRIILPHKGTRYIRAHNRPVFNDEGKLIRLLGVNVDITDLRSEQEMLRNQNYALEKAQQELDTFVYQTSHNLRAPLTNIIGILEILSRPQSEEEHKKFLHLALKSGQNLDETIKEIIDYSRNSRLDIEYQTIQFKELVEQVCESLTFMDLEAHILLDIDVQDGLCINSDQNRFKIILNNLISNAIKYHKPNHPSPSVWISAWQVDKALELEIRDNGIGIDPAYQKQIFEMFFRASEQGSGSGLGLYIVKEAVTQLGGTISLTSTPGEGSTFNLKFPMNSGPTSL